jgi:lipoprotein NlpI
LKSGPTAIAKFSETFRYRKFDVAVFKAHYYVFVMPRILWTLSFCLLLAVGCATKTHHSVPGTQTFVTPKLEVLNQQIARNGEDAQALSNRGYTLALLGRWIEARTDLEKAISLKDNGPMHNRVGWAYFNMYRYRDAVREFETAAKMSEHRAHYDYYSLVLGYWGTGERKKALENYQSAVERDPRFGEYKTLNERTAEWTPLERQAIHETYVLWSKTWKP